MVSDRVGLWRLRQSNPLRKSSGGRKKLDVEEARSLVLIICHLAKQHQELIRRAVALLEQMAEQNSEPHRVALLGDYLDTFSNTYQERMEQGQNVSPDQLTQLALKLLIDLLFYSSPNGHRRLWLALLERSRD
jgi:predicted Zn-dependent peptidase